MDPVIITGVPQPTGGILSADPPPRLEINDFIKNEKFFSLYIQALQSMYNSDINDNPISFYQISGIHGEPYVPWNNATPDKEGGYCRHRSILFPTWHRPYVALFEQALQQNAAQIAATYTVDRDSWVNAAAQLRQPYWDWARIQGPVPPNEIISMTQVEIIQPSGVKALVDNPWFAYRFPSDESRASFDGDFSIWKQTLRNPVGDGADAVTSVESLKENLNLKALNLRLHVYKALSGLGTWGEFSTKGVTQNGKPVSSLESIHDTIHVRVGWGGHMTDPSVAAFDPIFFLHHCQIDRLLSLWSAVHPEVWVSQDGDVDATTELLPFWNSAQSKWPSSDVQNTTTFNYTYPEFKGVNMNDPSAVGYIKRVIENLYNGGPNPGQAPGAVAIQQALGAPERMTRMAVTEAAPSAMAVPQVETTNWTARIRCNQFEVNGSFSVFVFIGKESEIPHDPKRWSKGPTLAGCVDIFVNSKPEHCANCMENADLATEGYVQLNEALQNSVHSVEDDDVVKSYLRENLHWRVAKADGTVVNLASLEVVVMATPVSRTEEDIFPILGEPRHFHEVTAGRS